MTFTNSILAGITLVRDAIKSENYVAGSDGWKISRNGDAEFNDVTVRGELVVGTEPEMVAGVRDPIQAGVEAAGVYWDGQTPELEADNPGGIVQINHPTNGAAEIMIFPQRNDAVGSGNPADATFLRMGNNGGLGDMKVHFSNNAAESFRYQNDADTAVYTGELRSGNLNTEDDRLVTRWTGTSRRTASVNNVSSEQVIDTLTATTVNGREYRLKWRGMVSHDTSGGQVRLRFREDNVTGQIVGTGRNTLPSSGDNETMGLSGYYVEAGTPITDKTFVVTLENVSGAGNAHAFGIGTGPALSECIEYA